jgi:hypothetical protein
MRLHTELVFVVALHATGAKKITATFVSPIFADGNATDATELDLCDYD